MADRARVSGARLGHATITLMILLQFIACWVAVELIWTLLVQPQRQ